MLLVAALLLGGAPVKAAPFEARLTALRAALERQAWSDAAGLARELEAAAAAAAPLEVSDGRALREPAAALGIYQPLADNRVVGAELYLYAQVRHHGLRPVGDGFELHLESDLVILDQAGTELARDERFGESRYRARVAHRDTFVNIALRVVGLPSGVYRARLIVHDRVANKRGEVEIPFVMP